MFIACSLAQPSRPVSWPHSCFNRPDSPHTRLSHMLLSLLFWCNYSTHAFPHCTCLVTPQALRLISWLYSYHKFSALPIHHSLQASHPFHLLFRPTAMLQQPRVPPTGQRQAIEVHIKWREVLDYKRELLRCLSIATGWGVDKLDADMQRSLYMRPQVSGP